MHCHVCKAEPADQGEHFATVAACLALHPFACSDIIDNEVSDQVVCLPDHRGPVCVNGNADLREFFPECLQCRLKPSPFLFLTDSGAPRPDLDLTAEFDKAVNNSKANKIFVVLHTYGSHFEYNKRYPREMAVFKPDSNSAAERGNRPQLVNAYDNTIHYTDSLLSSLITALDKTQARAALLYVSDHGEDIYDDARGRFLHASPVPTYQQLHVPMVMWMSESLRAAEPGKWQAAQTNRDRDVSSSRSVFHTLMDLAGLRSRFVDSHSSLVSPSYVPLPHTYLNDYNESVPLGESGLRDPDFTELRRKGFAL